MFKFLRKCDCALMIALPIIATATFSSPVPAQTLGWFHRFPINQGLVQPGSAGGILVDKKGYLYVSGSTTGDLYGDHEGDYDAFLARFNSDGIRDWGVQFGTNQDDNFSDIVLDNDGNLFAVGASKGSLFAESAGFWDAYVAKFDLEGNLSWSVQFGGQARDVASRVALDSQNNLYVVGEQDATTDQREGFVNKYDLEGNLIFSRSFGADGTILCSENIAINHRDEIFLGTCDEIQGESLRRIDAEGTELWSIDGINRLRGIAVDKQGHVYITGGPSDSRFLQKYDVDGNLIWENGGEVTGGYNVWSDDFGNVIVSGLDPRRETSTVLSSFASDGSLLWTRSLDGFTTEGRIAGDASGSIYYLGQDRRGKTIDLVLMKFTSQNLGDLDQNEQLDADDISELVSLIQSGTYSAAADFNIDRQIDFDDLDIWVHDLKGTTFGDSNLDGEFNSADLVAVFQAGEYEDDTSGNSTWSTGDWTGDGDFASSDLVLAFAYGGYEQGLRAAVLAVPEPSSIILLGIASLMLCGRMRR